MNRLFIVLVLLIAVGVGVGYYRGWFRVGSDSADGVSHITLTVDQKKIKEDEKKAEEKVHNFGHQEQK